MNNYWAFVGCNTSRESGGKGIYTLHFNSEDGSFTPCAVFEDIADPTFLRLTRNGQYLYAVIETDDFADNGGGVAAFRVNQRTGTLTRINQQATGGASPCHLTLDRTETCLVASNYTGGSVAVFLLNFDGSIGERQQLLKYQGSSAHPTRQLQPHAHSAIISPDNDYVFVQDLGTDHIYQYRLDTKHTQLNTRSSVTINLHAGAGPRHLIFHPSQPFAYLMNEINSSVVVFDYQPQPGSVNCLLPKQTISSLPNDLPNDSRSENTAADIHITNNGHFLYASNRGHDSLAIFSIHPTTGKLTLLRHQSTLGEHPRNFVLTQDNRFLLCTNRDSDDVVSFHLNVNTGELVATGHKINVPKPTCIQLSVRS